MSGGAWLINGGGGGSTFPLRPPLKLYACYTKCLIRLNSPSSIVGEMLLVCYSLSLVIYYIRNGIIVTVIPFLM